MSDELDLLQGVHSFEYKTRFLTRAISVADLSLRRSHPRSGRGLMRNNQLLELTILAIKVMILITEILLIR